MPANVGVALAAAGSTGNNTHTAIPIGADPDKVALEFNISAIGATPTVTFKFQGSNDGVLWYDLMVLPSDSATEAASFTKTIVAVTANFLPVARDAIQWLRLVTSANTNVTYGCKAWLSDSD